MKKFLINKLNQLKKWFNNYVEISYESDHDSGYLALVLDYKSKGFCVVIGSRVFSIEFHKGAANGK